MKAIVRERYGSPEVLEIRDVDTPLVGDSDVLITVEAASVNRSDWEGLIGRPLLGQEGWELVSVAPLSTTQGFDLGGSTKAHSFVFKRPIQSGS